MNADRHPSTLIVIAAALILIACAGQNPATLHPGAINAFDSNAYDSLVTAQGAIDAAKPLAVSQRQKDILNKVIAAYNEAKAAYLLYHSQAASGGQVDTSTLSMQLTSLVTATANLATQLKGAQ